MNYWLRLALSFTILVPVVVSWWRYKKIPPVYHPFIWCLWLGLLNEILSFILSRVIHSNAVNSNGYVLAESLFLLWQFQRWQLFSRFPHVGTVIACSFLAVWLVENFITGKITAFSSWFRILYSFVTVLMSIIMLNGLLLREKRTLLTHPVFLICAAFSMYYTYNVLVETFWVYGLNRGKAFRVNVYRIMLFINVISNLIYTAAILWIPTKHRSIQPS